jgi:hypothetical protein
VGSEKSAQEEESVPYDKISFEYLQQEYKIRLVCRDTVLFGWILPVEIKSIKVILSATQ